MSVLQNCDKLLKYAAQIMKEDGQSTADVKETYEWAKGIVNKSIIPKNIKATIVEAFEKAIKEL